MPTSRGYFIEATNVLDSRGQNPQGGFRLAPQFWSQFPYFELRNATLADAQLMENLLAG